MAGDKMRRFMENVVTKFVMPPTANVTDASYPASGSFIDVSGYERILFKIFVGATDDTAVTAKIQAATAANGALVDVTGAAITGTVLAGTNDNKYAVIELEVRKLQLLGADYKFVTLTVAATGGTATIALVEFEGWRLTNYPAVQGADCAQIVYVDG